MKRNLAPVHALTREVVPVVGSFAPAAIGGTLLFDTGTGNFTADLVLTGGTSAATATISAVIPTNGTLAYDAQSGQFEAAEVVTGGTSGATAVIVSDVDGGTTGTLTLSGVVGTFVDNEVLTGSVVGVAVVNGVLAATAGSLTLTGILGVFANNEAITDSSTGAALANLTVVYSANTPTAKKGLGWAVAWTSPGLYTVTYSDGFNSLLSVKAQLQLATGDDKLCQIGVVDLAARTFQIRVWDKGAAAVRDLAAADANNRIHFVAMFRDSAAKPECG